MKKADLLKLYNFWPPFLANGIRITRVAPDHLSVDVELRERFWNRNPMNSIFGGSIYSMTDPFYATLIKKKLGPDYIVWDKSADIRFLKPGKGTLKANFNITAQQLKEIKEEVDRNGKAEPRFVAKVFDESGNLVAEADKVVYIRRRHPAEPSRPVRQPTHP